MTDIPMRVYRAQDRGDEMNTPEPISMATGIIVLGAIAFLLGASFMFKGKIVF